ncbi:hypothetical protein [Glycomyces arizonensis]|uniref:hypothetical protein n=1 Tax=Glycomyces arizonensis TaxID=256035 RepID=UPI00042781B3|nr:hypothetical protein [Glycomyces arizonensis]
MDFNDNTVEIPVTWNELAVALSALRNAGDDELANELARRFGKAEYDQWEDK